ncbi:MAG TPA: DUF4328 domain-containing protein [Actinomycetota bacterium]
MSDPPSGEGAVRFSHSGERFVLGYGREFFGIWDRTASGGPVARFPRTDAGWVQAWNEFTRQEGRFVEVSAVGPATSVQPQSATGGSAAAVIGEAPSTQTVVYRSAASLSRVVVTVIVVVDVLAILTMAARAGLIARLHEFQRGTATVHGVDVAGSGVDALALATFLTVLVAGGVSWLMWQYRAHANLISLRVEQRRYSPQFAVAWWLIPLANLVMPLLVTIELWKASGARRNEGAVWKEQPTPPLLIAWWVFWVARIPIGAAVAAVAPARNATTQQLLTRAYLGLASDATLIVAGIVAIAVVLGIQRRQDRAQEPAMEPPPATL